MTGTALCCRRCQSLRVEGSIIFHWSKRLQWKEWLWNQITCFAAKIHQIIDHKKGQKEPRLHQQLRIFWIAEKKNNQKKKKSPRDFAVRDSCWYLQAAHEGGKKILRQELANKQINKQHSDPHTETHTGPMVSVSVSTGQSGRQQLSSYICGGGLTPTRPRGPECPRLDGSSLSRLSTDSEEDHHREEMTLRWSLQIN